MADFVAVIRRAVDGLTENTPVMRVRVYEKARGAVVRQLENMNPRPPEAMFKRQLDKLDDAVRQVEAEHSEALPADVAPVETAPVEVASVPPPVDGPLPQAAAIDDVAAPAHEPVAHHEPVDQAAVDDQPAAHHPVSLEAAAEAPYPYEAAREEATLPDRPAVYEEPVHAEPETVAIPDSQQHFQPANVEPVHAEHAHAEPAQALQPVADHIEAAAVVDDRHEVEHHEVEHASAADADHADPLLSHFAETREPAIRHASNRVMEQPDFATESEFPGAESGTARPQADEEVAAARPVAAMPDWGVDIDREPETAAEPPQMPRAALTETDVATGFNDFLKTEFATAAVQPPPVRKEPEGDFSWDAPFDDLPDLPKPVAFEQALHARQEELAKAPETKADRQRDARSELEDLIGYRPADGNMPASEEGDRLSPEVTRAMSKLEGKSFKVNRKNTQKFNPLPIAFGVAAALVVAGGAFGAYMYRDDVTKLVASYMPADTAPAKTETRAVADTPADESKSVPVKTDDAAAATQPADEAKPTEVASLDANIAPTKFTQRLMADGTEAETEAAKVPVDQSLTEGKTIAGQTVAAETEVASTDASTTTTDPVAKTEGLTAAQKMILYEERLGDSPVAVQGKVTWKLTNDTSDASGKSQPMIEATVEVPERKLKAVVSFKRNADASLPASHIIEVVFDLPEDFAEGNVESVQRVAFKQTEQDRGNSLIAVPAKITDDFHMIALNDDADARKVNTDLMKSRSWIDIPVVYRNNRRALLTFEKGSTGTEAFDKALAEWAALGPTATNN